jgi:DNA-binding transcriptional ArsR family regulator
MNHPATVSHHLAVLYDAGLVMRSRHRRLVLCRRSEQAASLIGQSATAS